jgi:cytosine/adenosine deaminase-related metal-dependent hydrolase
MRESAALARRYGVRLHTHIAETADEESYCREQFSRRPIELLDDLGWLGADVWLAHCVHLNDDDVARIARSGTAVASCPTSNMRLGSGFAPVRGLLAAGAAVGLGVDGSASNDAGHMLAEVRQAMLVARGRDGAAAMSARDALRLATRGGARCLGRDDVGSLEVGKRADLALFAHDTLSTIGAENDPVAALVFAGPARVKYLFVDGVAVVSQHIFPLEDEILEHGRRAASRILSSAPPGTPGEGRRP